MHDTAHRFGQRRLGHAELVRYGKQRAGRNQLVLGQTPRSPRAVEREAAQALFAARRVATPTVVALAAVDRTQGHPIAQAAQAHPLAHGRDDAGRFMAADEWRLDVLDALVGALLPGAQRGRVDPHQRLARTWSRHAKGAQLERARPDQHAGLHRGGNLGRRRATGRLVLDNRHRRGL